jgi:guanosine-3',5'-bis(diphosphate) 3'-pyrophosphohydrolase
MVKLHDAVVWAAQLHAGQDRDGEAPLPYITHPLEVLTTLRYRGGCTDEEMLCAAALHDVVEETEGTLAEIEARFGTRVASLVGELTRHEPSEAERDGLPPEEIYELRTSVYLEELKVMSDDARLIKLCDRFCNLREAERTRSDKKRKRYKMQTQRMLEVIPRQVNPELWDKIAAMSRT